MHPGDRTVPVCYRHSDRTTRLSCSECGRPICVDCSIDAAVGQKCPECAAHTGRGRVVDARRVLATGPAPVTYGIMAVAVVLFLAGMASPRLELETVLRAAQRNELVAAGEWWRLLSAAFLHANLTHILFNMWALYLFGPQLERRVGSVPFAALYLAAAVAGGAAAFFFGDRGDLVVGASGAIFGLFGVWLHAAWRSRHTAGGRELLSRLLFLLALNALLPFLVRNIAWQGHAGGLVAGFLIAEAWFRLPGPARVAARTAVAAGFALVVLVAVVLA